MQVNITHYTMQKCLVIFLKTCEDKVNSTRTQPEGVGNAGEIYIERELKR